MSDWFKEYIERMERENFDKTNKDTIVRRLNKRIRNYIDPPLKTSYETSQEEIQETKNTIPAKIISKL